MGFINVFVGSECSLKLKNNQLFLTKNDGGSVDYPIEDINSVLIENQLSVMSIQCINKLINNNVIVYVCDEKHLPSAYILGYNSFYKNLMVYNYQTQVPKPVQKQIWKNIIIQKIKNQVKVLDILKIDNGLDAYISQIKSGDADNTEGVVAGKYFRCLFGNDFIRRDDNLINSALNYGYAIIRGALARSVVAHGLQPYIGIHHCNMLNNFNLVDDLIEPFRPLVDLFVYTNIAKLQVTELDTKLKQKLHSLLVYDVQLESGVYDVSTAIDMVVSSLVSAMKNKKSIIKLPNILNLKVHAYE